VFALTPANEAVAMAVSLVIIVIALVSLPLDVVVVIESPTLKVFVNVVDVPVTAVPATDTVPGFVAIAATSRLPAGLAVPTPNAPVVLSAVAAIDVPLIVPLVIAAVLLSIWRGRIMPPDDMKACQQRRL
jgi:hypothetical protein